MIASRFGESGRVLQSPRHPRSRASHQVVDGRERIAGRTFGRQEDVRHGHDDGFGVFRQRRVRQVIDRLDRIARAVVGNQESHDQPFSRLLGCDPELARPTGIS
ncbi:MAG: hypothetical protein DMG07_20280 [Acidobacteria bacterium]|nr:MAG: hypothetical protein DMG07_20280 [Acidobacteriota bacterium]